MIDLEIFKHPLILNHSLLLHSLAIFTPKKLYQMAIYHKKIILQILFLIHHKYLIHLPF